jgi:nucleotide-binding universal stress UspA family protein
MYKHILIPTDGSALSEVAVRQGVALARSLGASTTAIAVTPTFRTLAAEPMMITDTAEQYEKDCKALAARYLGSVMTAATAGGVPYTGLHVIHDSPYEAIIEAAKKSQCDLIVMASHGRKGVAALVLGSETTKVLTHSKIPVLVCR